MAGLNPYNFRSVPVDPDSRLPSGGEVLTSGLQYDFGAARPGRVLKTAAGQRGREDRAATMRANLHTVDGEDERDLHGSWAQGGRGLGDDDRKKRSTSTSRARRSDTNRASQEARLIETAGRFAHAASVDEFAGYTQHLSNLDIGAGTPGDSMVTQFPMYRTPLSHPYLPSAAVAAQALQADAHDPQPMDPAMFAASIGELRAAAAAVQPPRPELLGRAEREKQEKARLKAARDSGPNSDAKQSIERYLDDSKALDRKHKDAARAGGRPSSAATHAERERSRYEARVAKLEGDLLHLRSDAEKQAARDAWKNAEAKYASIADASHTYGHAGGPGRPKQDPLAMLDGEEERDQYGVIPPANAAERKALHVSQLHTALARGEVLGRDFVDNLAALKSAHQQNLTAVEDLYYQQKLTAQLGHTLVANSAQQLESMGVTSPTAMQRGQAWAQQPQHPQQQHQHAIQLANPLQHADLSGVTDPRELAYRMGQSLRRDPRQKAAGVADSDDPRENMEKKRLAAMFDPEDDGRGYGRTAPRPRDAQFAEDDASAVEMDQYGRPIWREVRDDDSQVPRTRQHREKDTHTRERRDRPREHERTRSRSPPRHPKPTHSKSQPKKSRREQEEDDVSVHSSDDDASQTSRSSNRGRQQGRRRSRSPSDRSGSSRSRSRSGSSRSRSRSPPRARSSRSRSRSRSPRSRSRSPRTHSRSPTPTPSQIAGGLAQPREPSRSQKADMAREAARDERRQRRREEKGHSEYSESEDEKYPPRRSGDRSPRDMAPDVDDGLTLAQQQAQAARKEASRQAGGRPQTAGPGGRDRSTSRPRKAKAPPLDIEEAFPSTGHNARARAVARAQQTPLNQAHAFGPGRVLLDEDNRPRTAQPRDSRGAIKGDRGERSDASDSDSHTRRSMRLTQPEPFAVGSGGQAQTPSRTKQRLLEYLGEVKQRELDHTQTTFKANPLPVSTLEPRYEQMKVEAKVRSRALRKERRQLTQSMLKPFEFAASTALKERQKKKQRRLDGEDTSSASESESAADSVAPKQRSKPRGSRPKSDASASESEATGLGAGGDDSESDSDETDVASQASYQVAFGVTTRKEPRATRAPPPLPRDASGKRLPMNPHAQQFKANKIPWTSQVNMLDSIVAARENSREQRVRNRAKALLESSALPPRLEAHQAKKAKKAELSGDEALSDGERRRRKHAPPNPTHKPYVNPQVPDFDRLHAAFASDLDRVKRSREVTRVQEFAITAAKKTPIVHEQPPQFKAKAYVPSVAPEDAPPTTEKTKSIIARTKATLAAREEKERAAEAERAERLRPKVDMQSKLIPKIAAGHAHGSSSTADTIRSLTRAAKKDLAEKDAAWAQRVDEMKHRVRARPLLVESYNSAAGRIEARKKALRAIKESLDKAGIKDQAKFFDEQELADLDLKF